MTNKKKLKIDGKCKLLSACSDWIHITVNVSEIRKGPYALAPNKLGEGHDNFFFGPV